MQVLLILFLLILLVILIIHWKFTLPIFLLFCYFANYIAVNNKPKHPVRFHTLWWLVIILVVVGIVFGSSIIDFIDDYTSEYADDRYDDLVSRGISTIEPGTASFAAHYDTLKAANKKQIFGALEFGMPPHKVVSLLRENNEYNHLVIGHVYFGHLSRHYHQGKLYGISMDFDDREGYAYADSLTHFFKQKYGEAHLFEKDERNYKAEWHFEHKHLVIESSQQRYGDLYIYQPQMLSEKIAIHEEEMRRKREKQEQAEREEKLRDSLRWEKYKEEERQRKEMNRTLKESL